MRISRVSSSKTIAFLVVPTVIIALTAIGSAKSRVNSRTPGGRGDLIPADVNFAYLDDGSFIEIPFAEQSAPDGEFADPDFGVVDALVLDSTEAIPVAEDIVINVQQISDDPTDPAVLFDDKGEPLPQLPGEIDEADSLLPSGPENDPADIETFGGPIGSSSRLPDFNNDNRSDLVIGVPDEDAGTSSVPDAGAFGVIYGSNGGVSATSVRADQYFHQDSGLIETSERDDHLGTAFAWGDFDGDGFDDLAIGVPGESVNNQNNAGAVHVLYGRGAAPGVTAGLDTLGQQLWHQDAGNIEGGVEAGDGFGSALAAGDFNNDGFSDLAIGIPFEDVILGATNVINAGAVAVIYGSANGLTDGPDQLWTQGIQLPSNSDLLTDSSETNDHFGASLAVGNFNGGAFMDLAVGIPDEDITAINSAGAVAVIYGSASRLTGANNQFWHQDAGLEGGSEANDTFGFSLAAGNFSGDSFDDLAVGVPGEDIGAINSAGAVNVIYGSASRLTSAGDQIFHQDFGGINDTAETGDQFGYALAAGDFNDGGADDLAVGIPFEDISGVTNCGAVAILYASGGRLSDANDELFHQNFGTIEDSNEASDFYGAVLRVGRFNSGTTEDLAVGVPGEDIGTIQNAGAVNVLYGVSGVLPTGGLDDNFDQFFHSNVASVNDDAEWFDSFGGPLP